MAMKARDVTDTLELAVEAPGCNHATVAAELADYLDAKLKL